MRYYDRERQRFLLFHEVRPLYEELGPTEYGRRIQVLNAAPEVMLIHMVSTPSHDMLVMVNGVEILHEDHLNDERHRHLKCLSEIAVRLARALDTPLDVRRVGFDQWEAWGSPMNERLAERAREIALPDRVFAVGVPDV